MGPLGPWVRQPPNGCKVWFLPPSPLPGQCGTGARGAVWLLGLSVSRAHQISGLLGEG